MPDPRRSTAAAVRSLRNRFAWRLRTADARMAGFVGNLELGRRTPQPLEVVELAGALIEDVHDEAAEIQKRPFSGTHTFAVLRFTLQLFVQLLFHFGADGLHLRGAEARTNHKVGGKASYFPQIQDGDARCF